VASSDGKRTEVHHEEREGGKGHQKLMVYICVHRNKKRPLKLCQGLKSLNGLEKPQRTGQGFRFLVPGTVYDRLWAK